MKSFPQSDFVFNHTTLIKSDIETFSLNHPPPILSYSNSDFHFSLDGNQFLA